MDDKNKTIRQEKIIEKYGKIALTSVSCCDSGQPSCCSSHDQNPIELSMAIGYSIHEISDVPDGSNLNLGCGNPQGYAALKPGEIVLDLGSGAGFDCFLAARQVRPQGIVIGIDMTAEMVKKARNNAIKGSYTNTAFQLAQIEHLPLKSDSVDVIISNCVINLSTNKDQVFCEAYRVLKPGGRIAISDVIALTDLPDEIKNDLDLFSSCFSGAVEVTKLEHMLETIGFAEICIEFDRKSHDITQNWSLEHNPGDYIRSAAISASKIT